MTRRLPSAADLNAAEREAQGLPRYVTDPAALERVATLVAPAGSSGRKRASEAAIGGNYDAA